ncbi:hypothetical protein PM082_023700 [Marasmius tenuissimus]|nr:hypothetical protein PM082_023700 [Marasmius tenuissimus]
MNVAAAAPTPFSISCFSINDESPYQSTCTALSFEDEDLKSWLKTHTEIEKGHSRSEGEGFLYAFRIDGVDYSDVTDCDLTDTAAFKVGRTVGPQRRETEWRQQCRSQTHTWYTPIQVEHCHSVERLVHAALEKICVSRPRKVCTDCGRTQLHSPVSSLTLVRSLFLLATTYSELQST